MEVVGGVASIVNLVHLAAAISTVTARLIKRIHGAPAELKALEFHIQFIHTLLEELTELEERLNTSLLTARVRSLLRHTLESAEGLVKKVDRTAEKYSSENGIRGRIRFGLFDGVALQEILNQLRFLENHLGLLLQLLSLKGISTSLEKLAFLEGNHKERLDHANEPELGHSPVNGTPSRGRTLAKVDQTMGQIRSQSLLLPRWLTHALKWQCTIVKRKRVDSTDFSLHIRSGLPFLDYVIQIECLFRATPLCRSVSFLNGGGVGLSKVVPDDSDLMRACLNGDLFVVQELFLLGKARPDDVSISNITPMLNAIQSGNKELVEFLLDNCAGVNWTAGMRQTSPLQWAVQHRHLEIVRLLIQNDADLEHVSVLGWNPLFYCWPRMKPNNADNTELINLLAEHSILDVEMVDTMGWTALDRAAAFGTADEVQTLLKLGACPFSTRPPLRWNAMQHTVHFGNWSTFSSLMPMFGDDAVRMKDERGWTLLHIAAWSGCERIFRLLLSKGACPYIRSREFSSHMDEKLLGRALTAEEIAKERGPENHGLFQQALEDFGYDRGLVKEEETIFWDAQEYTEHSPTQVS